MVIRLNFSCRFVLTANIDNSECFKNIKWLMDGCFTTCTITHIWTKLMFRQWMCKRWNNGNAMNRVEPKLKVTCA